MVQFPIFGRLKILDFKLVPCLSYLFIRWEAGEDILEFINRRFHQRYKCLERCLVRGIWMRSCQQKGHQFFSVCASLKVLFDSPSRYKFLRSGETSSSYFGVIETKCQFEEWKISLFFAIVVGFQMFHYVFKKRGVFRGSRGKFIKPVQSFFDILTELCQFNRTQQRN